MIHDGVHPHLRVLAHEEGHVLAVARGMLSAGLSASRGSRHLRLIAHRRIAYGVRLWARVPGHRCRPGPGWPLQALGVVLQGGLGGRMRPGDRPGHLRLRRWLVGCPIALGVPLGFPQPDRAGVRVHSPGVPCRGLG